MFITFAIFMFVTCGIALWYGQASERLTAVTLIAAAFVSPIVEQSKFSHIELGVFAIDMWVTFFLLTLALQSDRFWPIWAASFQIVGVLAHGLRFIEPNLKPMAYITVTVFWAYPVLAALAIGTIFEVRRRTAEATARADLGLPKSVR